MLPVLILPAIHLIDCLWQGQRTIAPPWKPDLWICHLTFWKHAGVEPSLQLFGVFHTWCCKLQFCLLMSASDFIVTTWFSWLGWWIYFLDYIIHNYKISKEACFVGICSFYLIFWLTLRSCSSVQLQSWATARHNHQWSWFVCSVIGCLQKITGTFSIQSHLLFSPCVA